MFVGKESDMFKEEKTTHAAAYLLHKAGGTMHYLKLVQLMYLADRAMYDRYEFSMTGDKPISTDHGIMLSATLDLMLGQNPSDIWSSHISTVKDDELSLVINIEPTKLGRLSRGNREIMDEIFVQYGHKSIQEVCKATKGLPEWEDPHGGSKPVEIAAILVALGKDATIINGILEDLQDRDTLERRFTSL